MLNRIEPGEVDRLVEEQRGDLEEAREQVRPVVEAVREEGDEALHRFTKEFDGEEVYEFGLTEGDVEEAYRELSDEFLGELEFVRDNVETFHADQLPDDLSLSEYLPGVVLGEKNTPLESVGCYVPGGRAAYPSTALMTVVPAAVAGVDRVVVCSPPPVAPETVAAAHMAGADEIYRVGGGQAVAAMAHGTESIDSVEKIVGPGGPYVAAAKSEVRGDAEIDFVAGPSEVLILADSSAPPRALALDMAAQAEHGPDSLSVLVTPDPGLIDEVEEHLSEILEGSGRRESLEPSLERSAAVLVDDLDEGVEVSDRVAPEHLELVVEGELEALREVRNAGSVFVGPFSPVAAGDYATGANHVLPTAGAAKRVGGLDTSHFLKRTTVQRLDREGLEILAPSIEALGEREGLEAHVDSVEERLNDD